jgi:hypothetical protein
MDVGTIYEPSREFNRFQNYKLDTAIPTHRVSFNGIAELPFGKGKKYGANVNRFVDALIGGFEVAFTGTVVSQMFPVAAANWGATNPVELYKDSVPVEDCRSGVCRPAYLWFNGYIAPNLVNSGSRGVNGLPASYKPYLAPINNTPGTPNFGNNNVTVTLNDGRQVVTAYAPSPAGGHPFAMTMLSGPTNYQTDISLYKTFSISERWKLRINIDAFNAFNIQGYVNPNASDGIQQLQTSYWTPRQIQLTARLSF